MPKRCFRAVFMLPILATLALFTSCASNQSKISYADIPAQGDVNGGAQIFASGVKNAPACTTCHRTDSTTLVGPGMAGFAARATSRVTGLSAREYAYQSIVSLSRYIVSGFTNVMYDKYGEKLSSQEIADVIAYLISLQSN